MVRRRKKPANCLHNASGRAVVRLNGKECNLGPYGSVESHAEFAVSSLIGKRKTWSSMPLQSRSLLCPIH